MKTETFLLPKNTACYFMYGATDAYSEDDIKIMDEFVADNLKSAEIFMLVDTGDDQGFTRYHDLVGYGWLADDCEEMTFQVA